jgi:hypothetical protein
VCSTLAGKTSPLAAPMLTLASTSRALPSSQRSYNCGTLLSRSSHTSEQFPKDLFSVVFCFLLCLRAPLCLQSTNTAVCEGCGLHLDPYGHHRMTCAKTSSYQAAHSQLVAAFTELACRASAPYTDKNVPCHLTTEKVGDALINLSGEAKQLVLDFSITHSVLGARSANGTIRWNDKVLAQKAKALKTSGISMAATTM